MKAMKTILKEARLQKGWSLRTAAKLSGVSLASLSKLESGDMTNPTLDTIVAIVRTYGIPLDKLIDIGPVKFYGLRRTEKLIKASEIAPTLGHDGRPKK